MKSIAWRFQSTPPARGATTSCDPRFPSRNDFNPRPPRGGRRRQFFLILAAVHFNPRPPRGGRPFCCFCSDFQIDSFQSTPPARGATGDLMAALLTSLGISIHAPREGGDAKSTKSNSNDLYFNPRPPRGGRHTRKRTGMCILLFQSTPPARGATDLMAALLSSLGISIHAPREGGDQALIGTVPVGFISIHAPREGGDTTPEH